MILVNPCRPSVMNERYFRNFHSLFKAWIYQILPCPIFKFAFPLTRLYLTLKFCRLFYHRLKPVFRWATFFARSDFFLCRRRAYHISKCDADKGKSRFARKKSPSGKRALGAVYIESGLTRLTGLSCVTKIFPRLKKIICIHFMLFLQSN